MKYKVREHFFVHMDGQVYESGSELELNDEQALRYEAQIELVEAPKACRKGKEIGRAHV